MKFYDPKRWRQTVIFFGLIILIGGFVYGASVNSFKVDGGATQALPEDYPSISACSTIDNGSSNDYFVPFKTQAEWDGFRNNLPTGVTLGSGTPAFSTWHPSSGVYSDPYHCVGGTWTGSTMVGFQDQAACAAYCAGISGTTCCHISGPAGGGGPGGGAGGVSGCRGSNGILTSGNDGSAPIEKIYVSGVECS